MVGRPVVYGDIGGHRLWNECMRWKTATGEMKLGVRFGAKSQREGTSK